MRKKYLLRFVDWLMNTKALTENESKDMAKDIIKIKDNVVSKLDEKTQSTIWRTTMLFFKFIDERYGNNHLPLIRDLIYKHLSNISI